jgi:hypothetical protein
MQLHLLVVLDHLVQYFFNLAFLLLELPKLLVEIVDQPDSRLVEFVSIFILSISGDHRNVQVLNSK